MSDRPLPPKFENAPGVVLRPRVNNRWAVIWKARTDIIDRGYEVKSYRLATVGPEPSDIERDFISDISNRLQNEMLTWSKHAQSDIPEVTTYDGTLGAMIRAYQSDPDSDFHKLRFQSRRHYKILLTCIERDYGDERVANIRARQVKRMYENWMKRGLSMAHSLVGMLRTVMSFGATLLEDNDCLAVKVLLNGMRFKDSKPRTAAMSADQVVAVRTMARRVNRPSIALAQAFQFDLTLRQKDVIGEWIPTSEPGISGILSGNNKWMCGIRWEEVDQFFVLRHITSKRDKKIEVDLKLAPMVMEELHGAARSSLPSSGPIIVSEETEQPYIDYRFRRAWRKIADAAGVPAEIRNMDSRAGAITEALMSGARLQSVRKMATHSTEDMTQRYSRGDTEEIAEAMKLRAEHRNKPRK